MTAASNLLCFLTLCTVICLVKQSPVYTWDNSLLMHTGTVQQRLGCEEHSWRVYCILNSIPLRYLHPPFSHTDCVYPTQAASPSPAQISNPSTPKEGGGWKSNLCFSQLSGTSQPLWQELLWMMVLRTQFVELFLFPTTLEDFEWVCSVSKGVSVNKSNIQFCPNSYESKRELNNNNKSNPSVWSCSAIKSAFQAK